MLPLPRRLRPPRGIRDNQIAHLLEHPGEIRLFDREAIEIRRGIQPVDRVELSVADRELDGVHVVPERVGETDRVEARPGPQVAFDGPAGDIALVEWRGRVITDWENVLAPDGDAPDVVLPLDELLQDHRLRAVPRREPTGLVVRPDELLLGVDAIDVLPSAAGVRLQDRGQPRVLDERVPIERVLEGAQRLIRDVGDVRLVRETDGLRNRDTELARERALEELFVRFPPGGVVNYHGSLDSGAFQVGAVVRDLVADAVDDDRVALRLDLSSATQTRHVGAHSLRGSLAVDRFDERAGEGVLAADEQADDLLGLRCTHRPSPSSKASHEPNHPTNEARQARPSAAARPRAAWIRRRSGRRGRWR